MCLEYYFSGILFLFLTVLLLLCQLPARQEPALDSSKYTAADVRIVSLFYPCLSVWILFSSMENQK